MKSNEWNVALKNTRFNLKKNNNNYKAYILKFFGAHFMSCALNHTC